MNGRREKIMEYAGSRMPEVFEKSSRETALLCEKKSGEMAAGFLEAFRKGMRRLQAEKEDGSKGGGELSYIVFSTLHSSIFLKKYLIQVAWMGEGFYSEAPLAEEYWDAGELYSFFEQDIETVRGDSWKKVPRIREYEVDTIRLAYAPYYHRMAKAFIREMLGAVLEEGRNAAGEGEEEKKVKILFGEYMGEADVLFEAGKEALYAVF